MELISGLDEESIKGIPVMPVEKMVDDFLKGLEKDVYETCVGQARPLKFMGRYFPKFILAQMSKKFA